MKAPMKSHVLHALLATFFLQAVPVYSLAGESADRGREAAPRHQPPGPPAEAFEVCKGKAAGAIVALKAPDGKTVSGSCQLLFRPDRPPMGNDKPKS